MHLLIFNLEWSWRQTHQIPTKTDSFNIFLKWLPKTQEIIHSQGMNFFFWLYTLPNVFIIVFILYLKVPVSKKSEFWLHYCIQHDPLWFVCHAKHTIDDLKEPCERSLNVPALVSWQHAWKEQRLLSVHSKAATYLVWDSESPSSCQVLFWTLWNNKYAFILFYWAWIWIRVRSCLWGYRGWLLVDLNTDYNKRAQTRTGKKKIFFFCVL